MHSADNIWRIVWEIGKSSNGYRGELLFGWQEVSLPVNTV